MSFSTMITLSIALHDKVTTNDDWRSWYGRNATTQNMTRQQLEERGKDLRRQDIGQSIEEAVNDWKY